MTVPGAEVNTRTEAGKAGGGAALEENYQLSLVLAKAEM